MCGSKKKFYFSYNLNLSLFISIFKKPNRYLSLNAETNLVKELNNFENFSFDSVTFVVDSSRENKEYSLNFLTWYLIAQLYKYFSSQIDERNENEQLLSISLIDIANYSKKAQVNVSFVFFKDDDASDGL